MTHRPAQTTSSFIVVREKPHTNDLNKRCCVKFDKAHGIEATISHEGMPILEVPTCPKGVDRIDDRVMIDNNRALRRVEWIARHSTRHNIGQHIQPADD